ncbi:helix-turn-helix domain-containing protein [Labrys wisconsinensis]|uniref:AraC-like DNA-binding protein n=1 Tax=Labrys wisconsinensis TaxID=425677 RepID=A0ABU0JA55_9HYPH|nr:AraC family transcriptional regulator [Labrys wisconsinensis]MDQ0471143.1 AraC-like DNA-binding protein [Labrys wisconsinensis]
MPSVPLPFVVALLLGIALVRLARREEPPVNPLFMAMIAAYALQSVVIGLRWGYGIETLRFVQLVVAAVIPPLSWVAFSAFATGHPTVPVRQLWPHALAPAAIVLLVALRLPLIDPVLILTFLGYGVALIALARPGPDGLDRVKLDGAIPLHRALQATGLLLVFSAATDAVIAADLFGVERAHIGLISGLGSLCSLVLLAVAAIAAGDEVPDTQADAPPAAPEPEADDARILAELDALMATRGLYRDPELSLDRLARRLGLPARRISAAINRTRAVNVSQYVNEHRIAAACRALRDSEAPITTILYDVGFQTKSNFNREFLRVTGTSPSRWRAGRGAPAAGRQDPQAAE